MYLFNGVDFFNYNKSVIQDCITDDPEIIAKYKTVFLLGNETCNVYKGYNSSNNLFDNQEERKLVKISFIVNNTYFWYLSTLFFHELQKHSVLYQLFMKLATGTKEYEETYVAYFHAIKNKFNNIDKFKKYFELVTYKNGTSCYINDPVMKHVHWNKCNDQDVRSDNSFLLEQMGYMYTAGKYGKLPWLLPLRFL